MKIQIIDFGYTNLPKRAHYNDVGADVYSTMNYYLRPNETLKMPLGFGIKVPDGYMAYVYSRSGLSSKGIMCQLSPIDSGYRGEIHAVITNVSHAPYQINKGDRIGQLVIMPVILAEFVTELSDERGNTGFGGSGR